MSKELCIDEKEVELSELDQKRASVEGEERTSKRTNGSFSLESVRNSLTKRGSGGSFTMENVRSSFTKMHTLMHHVVEPDRVEYRWFRVFATAIIVGCIEYIPTIMLAIIMQWRHRIVKTALAAFGPWWMTWVFVIFAFCSSLIAVLVTVFIGPAAGGSGLPGIIMFLKNGKVNANQFTATTLGVKLVGTIFAIASGLAIGREGPAIHIGAVTGYLVYDYFDQTFGTPNNAFDGEGLHDSVVMGCAAGFASAFRAPMAGMMYTFEELSTHWGIKEHSDLGGKVFLCTALAALVIQFLVEIASDSSKGVDFNSIIIFGRDSETTHGFKWLDLPYIMILGVICGLSSALQTRLSIMMFKLRKSVEWMRTSWGRVLDVVVLACITAFVYATLPQILGKCVHESAYDDDHRRLSASSDNRSFWVWTCDGEYEYNEMASMSLSGSEGVIQHLFARDNENFGVIPTMTMFLCYFPLAVLVIGTAVPAGTFVPSLMLGGLMGRLVGELCGHIHGTGGKAVSTAGVYAEIGAGAMLGGWTRTMIAICVLMAEITGDVSLTIPLIISVKIARQVAEYYEPEGLTHALMHFSGMDAHDSLTPVLWVDPVDQAAADAATKATMESLGLDSSLDYADMEIEDEEEAQNAEEPEKEDPDRRRTLKRRPSTTFM